MSLLILDTDTLSLFRSGHRMVVRKILSTTEEKIAVTVITVEEQFAGWFALLRKPLPVGELARTYDNIASAAELLGMFRVVSFSEECIQRFTSLRAMKLNVASNDLRIAAIALEHSATVVTRNIRDFGRVPGLRCEDWSV